MDEEDDDDEEDNRLTGSSSAETKKMNSKSGGDGGGLNYDSDEGENELISLDGSDKNSRDRVNTAAKNVPSLSMK